MNPRARCFVALIDDQPAAFASSLAMPLKSGKMIWREHRTVCLPDFQGVGIGNALSEHVAAAHRAVGERYRSVTSSPAMIAHRARSPLWLMDRKPGMVRPPGKTAQVAELNTRWTASFEYMGPKASPDAAKALLPEYKE